MKTLIAVILIMLGGLMTFAQKVQVGADRTIDISKYRTYGWDMKTTSQNPHLNQMVIDNVDLELAAKGLRKVDSDPELIVVFWAAAENDLHITYPTWAPGFNSVQTGVVVGSQSWPVTKGTLVIDISDSKTKNGVWRGTATDTLKHGPTGDKASDAKSVEKQLKKSIKKMFKQFPRPSGN